MSGYLIILYRKHCVFYKTWFDSTNRIQQDLQLFFVMLNLFWASFIQAWLVSDVFLDLFSNLFSLVFF